jgi:hypothetical protein
LDLASPHPHIRQCDTVQGELLRAVEKLAWETRNNGNWDSGFEILSDFLESTLCAESLLSDPLRWSVRHDLDRLRDFKPLYPEEDLFDRLREAVVASCRHHPRLLPRAINPSLHR